jgi:xylulokinase
MNAARVLDAAASILGVSVGVLSDLALSAEPGAKGLTFVPYLEGERTPNLPTATGAVHGLTLANATPSNLARAAVEGMLCGLSAGLDALTRVNCPCDRVLLIGGAAESEAVRQIAPTVFGVEVEVLPPGDYVAAGAARQAAWVLSNSAEPPNWPEFVDSSRIYKAEVTAGLQDRYRQASQHFLDR